MHSNSMQCRYGAYCFDARVVGIWVWCSCIWSKTEYPDFHIIKWVGALCPYLQVWNGAAAVDGGRPVWIQAVIKLIMDVEGKDLGIL